MRIARLDIMNTASLAFGTLEMPFEYEQVCINQGEGERGSRAIAIVALLVAVICWVQTAVQGR